MMFDVNRPVEFFLYILSRSLIFFLTSAKNYILSTIYRTVHTQNGKLYDLIDTIDRMNIVESSFLP